METLKQFCNDFSKNTLANIDDVLELVFAFASHPKTDYYFSPNSLTITIIAPDHYRIDLFTFDCNSSEPIFSIDTSYLKHTLSEHGIIPFEVDYLIKDCNKFSATEEPLLNVNIDSVSHHILSFIDTVTDFLNSL